MSGAPSVKYSKPAMLTELDRLLERVTLEPAYGPVFFKALLDEHVFALMPIDQVVSPGGRVRLIMWTGEDGVKVIPFFSNASIAKRAIAVNPATKSIRLLGRTFLDASRGAPVVLNPNEPLFCRLSPGEVALLLDTGSPNKATRGQSAAGTRVGFSLPPCSGEVLHSLVLLLSQFPAVDRAYLGTLHTSDSDEVTAWVLAFATESEEIASRLGAQLSAMLADAGLPQNVDLLQLRTGSQSDTDFSLEASPFYTRALGERLLLDIQGSIQ